DIKTAQGRFNFNVEGQRTIRVLDVSFTPKTISRQLTQSQGWTFQSQPFTPMFIVEVGDTEGRLKFEELDHRFKHVFFATSSDIQLGWLIDLRNKRIWIYKRNQQGNIFHREHTWEDINGGDVLPRFILKVSKIEDTISQ
ncbi:5704_t:CDS:1, partial [Scutellospora calospora]